ncbi:MAG: hemerythrin domain-containing protein [Rhizobiaceae bacterium]
MPQASHNASGNLDAQLLLAMRLAHNDMLAMCDLLEDIADSLPHHLDAKKCALAAETLEPLVAKMHRFEEDEIFPRFAGSSPDKMTLEMLDRLREEHCVDECYAEELTDALRKVSSSAETVSPETLGYMLRGFFEAMRRHLAFERAQFSRMFP